LFQLKPYRSLYLAFDQFPGTKGAATHIAHSSSALFESFQQAGLLFTLGDETQSVYECQDGFDALRFQQSVPGFVERSSLFSQEVADVVDELSESLQCVQFRDPWSGVPVLNQSDRAGGMPDMLEDGVDGFLFQTGDAADCETAIAKAMASTPAQRQTMGEHLRQKITARYTPIQEATIIRTLFESTITVP